jgi:hypothetical protein
MRISTVSTNENLHGFRVRIGLGGLRLGLGLGLGLGLRLGLELGLIKDLDGIAVAVVPRGVRELLTQATEEGGGV